MPSPRSRRRALQAVLAGAALSAACAAGCSLVVGTDGLSGGDAGNAPSTFEDSGGGGIGAGGDATLPDGSAGKPVGDDAGAKGDAGDLDTGAGSTGGDGSLLHGGDAGDASHDAAGTKDAAKASDGGCTDDLSNIGTGDFHISFTLRTTQSGKAALVNQRAACGPGTFWDLRLVSGQLDLELDDVSSYAQVTTSGPQLDDGASHTIAAARVSGTVSLTVDGSEDVSSSSGSGVSLGALVPLSIGSDGCDGPSADGGDGTSPISPSDITGLCITSP